jgi:hypothetical protein
MPTGFKMKLKWLDLLFNFVKFSHYLGLNSYFQFRAEFQVIQCQRYFLAKIQAKNEKCQSQISLQTNKPVYSRPIKDTNEKEKHIFTT